MREKDQASAGGVRIEDGKVQAGAIAGRDVYIGTQINQPQSQQPEPAQVRYLPFQPTHLVGRKEYFDKLRTALLPPSAMFLLTGDPGSGKSSLAQMFAWQVHEQFDVVIYQMCGERSVDTIGGDLADTLRPQLGDAVTSLPLQDKLRVIKNWLELRHCLLILDDVWLKDQDGQKQDSAQQFQILLPAKVSILFTSRRPSLPWVDANHRIRVAAFTPAEVEATFRLYLGESTVERHRTELLEFAERVERLPIAVAVAAQLLDNEFGPLKEAARGIRLQKLRTDIHDVPSLLQHAIEAQGPQERGLLRAAALCVPESFWLPLAIGIAGLAPDQGAQARNHLVNAALLRVVDQDRQRFDLHSLVREQLYNDPATEELRSAHARTLRDLFAQWETRWKDCRECLAEIIPAVHYLHRPNPEDGSLLGYYGYLTARRIGELDTALRIEQQNERLWSSVESPEGKYALQASYGNQALILLDWGRLEEAMALLQKQEALCVELGNRDGLQASYGNQALILRAWGRLEEAMALLREEEALCVELGNRDGLQHSYGNQALILKDWGRLEEAMALLQKEEALCVELGNRDGLQRSYGNQALILKDWGRLEEAMDLLQKQEALCVELGSKDGLSRSYGNQAGILKDWGRLEEAMALYQKEEALCVELGNRNGLQRSYGNQALILKDWGRLEEAMALHQKKEALCVELGNKNSLQISYVNQAGILKDWGRLEEAMALLQKQEALCVELGNKNSLQASYGNQALILKDWGRLEEAVALHQKQEALCVELGNKDGLAYCYWNWGLLAREMKDHQTAKEKLQTSLAIFTELKMPRERDAVQSALNDGAPLESLTSD
jgi:tetratricopeptide (TPR) repeat protein